jgi:hypothetical protein
MMWATPIGASSTSRATRIALGTRFGLEGQGACAVTVIDPGTEQASAHKQDGFITLNAPAVFQLLLFGPQDEVRASAAHALEPLINADRQRIECVGADFDALPRWEQVVGLLVATMTARFPEQTSSCDVDLDRPPCGPQRTQTRECPPPRIFRYTTDPELRRAPYRRGVEEIVSRRVTYAIDTSRTAALESYAERSWLDLAANMPSGGVRWSVDDGAFGISFAIPYKIFRGRRGWQRVRLLSPDGKVVAESKREGKCPLKGWELDPALLLRLQAGALQGYVLERWYAAQRPHWDRHSRGVVTVELGASIEDPPIVMMAYGHVTQQTTIDRLAGNRRFPFPLLGGATLESLDAIARRIGVWHGESLRGSFTHHPLRQRSCMEAA